MVVLDGKSRDQYNDYPTERKKKDVCMKLCDSPFNSWHLKRKAEHKCQSHGGSGEKVRRSSEDRERLWKTRRGTEVAD